MSDHADHHHAAPAKPNMTTFMGIALFFGIVTVTIALVGAIRNSQDILYVGLFTGLAALVLALLASGFARRAKASRRGFVVTVLLGLTGVAMYTLVTSV